MVLRAEGLLGGFFIVVLCKLQIPHKISTKLK